MKDKLFISKKKAKKLIKKGYFAVDGHIHSSASYDVADVPETHPKAIVKRLRKKGLIPLISDHDSIAGLELLNKNKNSDVIWASEIKIKPEYARKLDISEPMHTLHITVSDITKKDFEVLEEIASNYKDLDMFMDYVNKNNIKAPLNHAYWQESGEKLNKKAIPQLIKNYFDVVEVNAGRPKELNNLVIKLAKKYKKGIIAASDNHTGKPGTAYSLAKASNYDEYWEKVKARENYILRKDMTPIKLYLYANTVIDQIFKTSNIEKIKMNYTPQYGVRALDSIVTYILSEKIQSNYLKKKIFHNSLLLTNQMFGHVVGWLVYIKPNNDLGKAIDKELVFSN